MIGIEIKSNVQELIHQTVSLGMLFRLGSSRVKQAGASAINDSLRHMRSLISLTLRDTYYIKKQDLDPAIHIIGASASKNMMGTLRFQNRLSFPLINFSAKESKSGVSVKVLKAHRKRTIRPGGAKKIMTTPKGKADVWIAKGQVMARTDDSRRPIVLFGPSFMTFFKRPHVPEALNIESRDYFLKRLDHHLSAFMSGFGMNNFGR